MTLAQKLHCVRHRCIGRNADHFKALISQNSLNSHMPPSRAIASLSMRFDCCPKETNQPAAFWFRVAPAYPASLQTSMIQDGDGRKTLVKRGGLNVARYISGQRRLLGTLIRCCGA